MLYEVITGERLEPAEARQALGLGRPARGHARHRLADRAHVVGRRATAAADDVHESSYNFV